MAKVGIHNLTDDIGQCCLNIEARLKELVARSKNTQVQSAAEELNEKVRAQLAIIKGCL